MIKRDNHYVPHSHLKRWADNNGKVWSYRLLVAHENAGLWKAHSPKSLAYQKHLYTRVIASGESDDIECWFDTEFESPAGKAIQKATSDGRLSADDWRVLIRFLAAQDARTPARLAERLRFWREQMPTILNETLAASVQKLEAASRAGVRLPKAEPREEWDLLPAQVTINRMPDQGKGQIQLHATVGRSLWLFGLKHLLTETIKVLYQHKWTILRCPPGMEWLTSDDPVVRLNYHSSDNYNFGGGWGSEGTEIFMALSPTHLMYTKVGRRPPEKGHFLSADTATSIQRFMVERAHRYVFSRAANPEVALWRPRTVNSQAFHAESEQWDAWNKEQSEAERALLADRRARTF